MKNPSKKQDAEGNWQVARRLTSGASATTPVRLGGDRPRARPPGRASRCRTRSSTTSTSPIRRAARRTCSRVTSILKVTMEKRSSVCQLAPTRSSVAPRQGALPVQLQGGGGREDLHPAPAALDVYLPRAARHSLQPGYTHGLEWPAKRAAPPDWNPTGERRSITYRRQGVEPSSASRSPLPGSAAPVPPSELKGPTRSGR